MYLKTIEIHGFKSFTGRTVFHFKPGITGIVGPNGSGKSNIADAVRWVLGEQRTTQLRSGSMQDVIFAGTQSRKPLSFASVTLTIDNSDNALQTDYTEVSVTRKIYRSGESEYLINKTPCRLRDIQELFYDTGVGREGYSLIGQGQIDRIISGNPLTRRELLDEAAGIVKHKKRKEAAIKKLDETQQNLVRVDDILSELQSQVGPLKRQARKAQRYLALRDEMKTCDINRFLLEVDQADQLIAEDRENLSVARDHMRKVDDEYEASKSAYGQVEEQIAEIDVKAETARARLSATDKLKTELEGQISLLKEQISSALTNREHIRDRQRELQGQIESADRTLTQLTDRYKEESERLTRLQEENEALIAKLDETKVDKEERRIRINELRESHLEMIREKGEMSADRQKNDALLSQLRIQCSEEADTLKSLTEEQEAVSKNLAQLKCEHEKLKTRWEETGKRSEELKAAEDKAADERNRIARKADQVFADYQACQTRLTELRNLTERYEGFGESVRRVMEAGNAKVHGVVADLIKTEDRYTEAIETALGRSLRHVVTDDENTARDMITMLKKNRYGRATFLPLSAIRPSGAMRADVLKEKGVIGTADTLVSAGSRYSDLVSYLLGRIVVVDDLDHAIAIAKKYQHSVRIVTLEGDQLSPGGVMSGGAYRHKSQLLSRRAELDRLTGQTAQLKEQAESLKKQVEELNTEVQKTGDERQKASEKLQEIYTETRENEVRLTNAERENEQLSERIESLQAAFDEKQKRIETLNSEVDEIRESQDQSGRQEIEFTKELRKLEEEDHKASERTRQIAVEGEQAHVALAECRQQVDTLKASILRIRREQEERRQQADEFSREKPDTTAIIEEKENKIRDIEQTIESSEELFEALRAEIKESEEEKAALTEANRDAIERREQLMGEHADLEREIMRLENRIEANTERRNTQTDYMWEEYELTYHNALPLRNEEMTDLRELREQSASLRKSIRDLGNVNVNAIEQYKETGGRFEEMSTQREDIMKAQDEVLTVIEDLDKTMKKRFDEAFSKINEQFDEVFKVLFGGGKGHLELIEDDVLSAGVRVIAQPPGKKLQNMMQLSGGEKSLSAIALLFAIQNLHPSPFCLLDEIEASLDDNNVVRYCNYLRKLSEQTQFIVITHRQGTMNAADRLYGITMQEKGVSTMVSVDLAKEQIEQENRTSSAD